MTGDQLGNFMYEVQLGAVKNGGPSPGGGGHVSTNHNALGGSKKSSGSPRPGVGNPAVEELHQ